jgi:hypothetical protein
VLYRTPIGPPRVLRWTLLYAALAPAALVVFSLFYGLREGPLALRDGLWAAVPWPAFAAWSGALALVLTGLAWREAHRNNARWRAFFEAGPRAALEPLGFRLDRYGLHGFVDGYPVSLHFEKETLGDYALISVYAPVSDDVDRLRELGAAHGKAWFFRFDAVEHFVDPPFGRTDWPAAVHRAVATARDLDLKPLPEHPWLPSSTPR